MGQPIGGQSATDGGQSAPNTDPTGTTVPDPNATPPAGPPVGQSAVPQTYTQADIDAITARLSAADKKRADAEAALKKINDAALTEAERTANALKESQAELEQAKKERQEGLLDNAVLLDTTYDWHDRSVVLQQIDRSALTFAEDGKVTGVKAALDKLAKEKPFLLKPKGDSGGDNNGSGQTGASGTTRQHGKGTDQAALEKKWPAMRGRVS